MAWTPVALNATSSSADFNDKTAAGIVRFVDAGEQTAAETNTVDPFPTGGWAFRVDTGDLIQRTDTGWNTILNLPDALAVGKPSVAFFDTGGTVAQGTLTLVKIGAGNWRLTAITDAGATFFNVEHRTNGVLEIKAQTASGLQLVANTGTDPSKLVLTDTAAELVGNTSLSLRSPTLALSALSDTAPPRVSIGGATVAANRYFGTDNAGNFADLPPPREGPVWLPTTLGTAGQSLVVNTGATAAVWAAGGSGAGVTLTDVVAQTTYASAVTQANANTTANVALPADFDTGNTFVYLAVTDSGGDRANALVRTGLLASLTGSSYVSVGGVAISGHSVGQVFYRPSDRNIHIRISGAAPRFTYVGLIGPGTQAAAATTFLALTDTPAAFGTAGQIPIINAAGTGLDFGDIPPPTIGPNTITAAQARLDTTEHRQEWHHRLDIPAHDTVGIQDFTVFSGVPTAGGLVGFAATQAGTINGSTSSASFRVNDNLYSVTQIAQITTAGTNLNNIIVRIGPDPETNGDLNADWYFQIGGVFLSFANATKATVPGNRVTYTWTGSPRLFIGGQATICRMRQPLDDIHSTIPTNFSALQGTVAPEQFRDSSIRYTRAIGGSLTDQAGWRSKIGFAALTSNPSSVLKFRNGQIVQEPLDITSLNNFGPNAEPSAGVTPLLMKWGPGGLNTVQRLDLADFPQPPGIAAGYIPKWDGTAWIVAAETGGTGSAFSWATAGRMPSLNNLPAFTSGNRKVIIGTTTNNQYEFRQPQFSDLANQIGASQIGADTINGSMVGADTLVPRNINVGGANLAAWQTKLGITTPTTGNAATWAQAGNTDLIPDSKLDPFVYHSFSKLETMVLTVGHYTGARGFDRITGGGGSLTNDTFHLPGGAGNIQVIAIDQLPSASVGGTSEITISLVGVLPLDFNQFYLVFERAGFAKVLRFEDATMRTPPRDTNYPAGLQNYTSYTWSAQPDNILYRQAANSTTNVFIAAPFDIAIEQYLLLPELPTTAGFKFLVGNNGGLRYRDVDLTGAEEANFTINVPATNRTNQTAQQVTLTGSGVADFFTRSGSVLTARKNGWVHISVAVRPAASNEGQVLLYAAVNGTKVARSERTVEYYRDVILYTFVYDFRSGQTLTFHYQALDVPTSATEANVPATPAISVTEDDANHRDTIRITSPSNTLFQYSEISKRIHGAGTTDWTPWERVRGNITTIVVNRLYQVETDYRVRLVNAAGTGKYRQWLAGGGTVTAEEATAGFGQTIALSGSVHISRQALNIA